MQTILFLLLKYKYLVLFPLAALEGPVISLAVGFLVHAGIFNFWPAFIILLIGDIFPDTIYFYLGYFSDKSKFIQKHFLNSKFFTEHSGLVKKLWTKHTFKTMFLGKLAYGMAIPFLMSAGMMKITYKKFILHTIPISIFQYGIIMLIGYFMGSSYQIALKYINNVYYIAGGFIILAICVYILVTKYARIKVEEIENEE